MPPRRRGSRGSIAVVAGSCAMALLAIAAPTVAASSAAASSPTPYSDPAVSGYLGLCDAAGHQVTNGSVDARPFVVHAVSSAAAPSQYRVKGSTATLYAFQPREQTPASAWSGEQLTGAAQYTNGQHPESAATPTDLSLGNFLQAYPAMWNGFVELRMYLGAPGQQFSSTSYAATDLEVSGNTWHTVDGGTVDCHAGTSVSNETLLLPKSDLRAPKSSSTDSSSGASHQNSAPTQSGGSTAGGASSPAPGSGSVHSSPVADDRTSHSHSMALGLSLGTAALVLVLVLGGFALVRRRS